MCRVVTYTREEGDSAPIDVAKVEEMLFQRSQLRQDRSFVEADAIQAELLDMGVTVFDREMKWFVGKAGPSAAGGRKYMREVGDVNPVDTAAVEALIAQRNALRRDRDWNGADMIRDRLRSDHGVYLKDKELKWYVGSGGRSVNSVAGDGFYDGGAYGQGPPNRPGRGRVQGGRTYDYRSSPEERRKYGKRERQERLKATKAVPYSRETSDADPDELTEAEIAEIQAMVDERLQAKLHRNFNTADDLLETLNERGVQVSDDLRRWRTDGKGFLNTYLDEDGSETPEWIATAIAQRGEAKRTKDYEKADRILAQLELEGIGIDDLRRTWRYLPAPKTGYAPPPAEAEESW